MWCNITTERYGFERYIAVLFTREGSRIIAGRYYRGFSRAEINRMDCAPIAPFDVRKLRLETWIGRESR